MKLDLGNDHFLHKLVLGNLIVSKANVERNLATIKDPMVKESCINTLSYYDGLIEQLEKHRC